MHVHLYVCMQASMSVCLCSYTHSYVYVCMYVCKYACMYASMCVCMCMCMHVGMHEFMSVFVYMRMHTSIQIRIHVMNARMHAIFIHTYTHACIYASHIQPKPRIRVWYIHDTYTDRHKRTLPYTLLLTKITTQTHVSHVTSFKTLF
jgi:hypothetical protein